MMESIAPNTPCFLVKLSEMEWLSGRVVTVIALGEPPDGETGDWYQVDADWISSLFNGRDVLAPRENLRPIVPPRAAPAVGAYSPLARWVNRCTDER